MSNLLCVPMACGVTYSSWVELRASFPAASLRDDVTVETVTSIDIRVLVFDFILSQCA